MPPAGYRLLDYKSAHNSHLRSGFEAHMDTLHAHGSTLHSAIYTLIPLYIQFFIKSFNSYDRYITFNIKAFFPWFFYLQDDGGIEFFNTIVLQPHLKLVTDLGRGYHVRCRYQSREAATKQQQQSATNWAERAQPYRSDANDPIESSDRRDHGRSLDIETKLTTSHGNGVDADGDVPMPGCHMKIYTGDKIAENVKIGDPLTLVVNIDEQELYGLHVTDCLVRDGLGWGEQKLINDNG